MNELSKTLTAHEAAPLREQPRTVHEEILNRWKLLRERGDVVDIQVYSTHIGKKLSRQNIMNALRGFCTLSTQTVIDDFYKIKAT